MGLTLSSDTISTRSERIAKFENHHCGKEASIECTDKECIGQLKVFIDSR